MNTKEGILGWLSKKVADAKIARALGNAHEEMLYAQAASEIAEGNVRPGLWAKALSLGDGSEDKAKAKYMALRVEQIQIQLSAAGTLASHFQVVENDSAIEPDILQNETVATLARSVRETGYFTEARQLAKLHGYAVEEQKAGILSAKVTITATSPRNLVLRFRTTDEFVAWAQGALCR
jgi:hypothetical protein